ncbi:MAG: carbonic anhydrase [Alphaproteobacteria bacterium]
MVDHLIDGYRRFRAETWPRERDRFEELAKSGQKPHTMVIACSDSRIDPHLIFDTRPGELFVVRNVANLVPPFAPDAHYHGTSAALEFAVRVLKVQHLIVLGHALCGGVQGLLSDDTEAMGDFVRPWMSLAAPARARTMGIEPPEARQQACEFEMVRLSLAYLWTFPWIRDAVDDKTLKLHGAYFGVRDGVLLILGSDGEFRPLPEV